jgi:hypothetical protein
MPNPNSPVKNPLSACTSMIALAEDAACADLRDTHKTAPRASSVVDSETNQEIAWHR